MKSKRKPSSVFNDALEEMFVTNTRGELFIFPWGKQRNGYLLEDPSLKPRIKRFYGLSLLVYFAAVIILYPFRVDFWFIVSVLVICSLVWLAVWYLYSRRITKSSKITNARYSEIVLEKIASSVPENERSSH